MHIYKCGEKYIGQTGNVIRNRVRVHKQQILHEDKRMLGMSEHISKCSQNYSPNFKIIPFFKIKSDNEDFRKKHGKNDFMYLLVI